MHDLFPFYRIGHFINQPDNPTLFEITRFEEMADPDVADIHKHTFYEIIWFDEGISRQSIDYVEYKTAPGMLFFISPGQVHQFDEWQPLCGGSIFFTEEFLTLNRTNRNQLLELSFLDNLYVASVTTQGRSVHPFVQPDPGSYAEIRHMIDLLIQERQRPNYSTDIAQALLSVILLQIQRCVDAELTAPVPKPHLVLYKRLRQLIDNQYRELLSASDYADQLNVTQHHLNCIVKRVTGQTTTVLIRSRSILEAKRLLTFSDQTVTEIAAQLGYFDSSYFARLFRADTGLSPAEFRATMSEKYRIR